MWEVADETVRGFAGGYAAYVLARAERARQADASESRRQNLLRKELAWLRRGPPARTSKPQFRIDAAEALIANVPPVRSGVELRALAQRRLGRTVFGLEDVTVRAGSRTLLDHVSWHVGPGDRIGVIGVNGSGKTHLLRLLAGTLAPDSGRVEIGQSVHSATSRKRWASCRARCGCSRRCSRCARTAELGGVELSATQLAERFGFANNRQWTPWRTCPAVRSGGCSCCGYCSPSRTSCCSTSRPTISTPTLWRRSRICSTRGPARWWSCRTIATSSSASAIRPSRCSGTGR